MWRATCASLLGGLLATLIQPSPASAATPWVAGAAIHQTEPEPSSSIHDWGNLAQLRQGDRIVVTTSRSRQLEGQFMGCTASAVTFTVEGELVSIERESVAEVQSREKSHKVRNAVLTLGVSLLVGWIAGAGAEASSEPDQASQMASSASLDAGRATHEALPKYAVIYRAPPPVRD